MRQLELENAKLKKLLAELDLEMEVMKEVETKNGERVRASPTDRVSMCRGGGVRADVGGSIERFGTSRDWRRKIRWW